ncbi:MAG: PilZ domain-containing protein [gamma proteobacterium symbiont of Taylorina sp.]|nr:PilZ domain-containing protein [gamma proteobacterium symbiont of Taylorina sp.]
MHNHRRFSRFSTNIPATLVIEGMLGKHKLYLNDASQGGLSFNALAAIKKGTHLQVSFSDSCKTQAQIAWCRPLEHCRCQLGLSFDHSIKPSSLDKIVSSCT